VIRWLFSARAVELDQLIHLRFFLFPISYGLARQLQLQWRRFMQEQRKMIKISVRKSVRVAAVGLFAVASFAIAQDVTQTTNQTPAPNSQTSTPTGGWRRVGDAQASTDPSAAPQISQSSPNPQNGAPPAYPESTYPQPADSPQAGQQPMGGTQQQGPMQQTYPQQQYPVQRPPLMQQGQMQGPYAPVPAQIAVPAGTYLTVRVNQRLSSDHNQVGDPFSATLVRPLVVNGVVLAEPGQTIGGRIAQVQKSGHVSGLAKLGVELTDLALVDGQQLPIKTMLVSRTANSTTGRDAGAIAGTTALGAAAGAVADLGRGAAIGAGAGAVVGIVGVLVTRGQPSVIYPEQELTFRIEEPLTVSTEHAPQAFRYVQPNEYSNQLAYGPGPGYGAPAPGYAAGYAVAPAPYYGYPYYGYPYYPYAGFSLFVGPGYYGRGFYGPRYYGGVGFRGGIRR